VKKVLLAIIGIISLLTPMGCTCSNGMVFMDTYGDVIPSANVTYDLGSQYKWWDNIWVGTIHAANVISSNATASNNVTGVGTAGTIPQWNSPSVLGDSPLTHFLDNINFGNHNITNVGTVSGHTMSGNLSMGSYYINNLSNPSQLQDAATKYYVDTMASIPIGNVFTVAKSGSVYTTIQSAINAAAADSPSANSPKLVRIAPGVYNESITCASYVHLASIGGSYGAVIIQQTDADVCTLSAGATNISGITFRIVTPTQARTVFKDNGNANFCYMENVVIQITTPSTFAHKLIAVSGTGTVLVLANFYASVGGTGASRGIDITSLAVVTSSGMELSFTNSNAFDLACSNSQAVVSMMNSVLGGTANLFNITGGTFQWTGCRLTGMGISVVNQNATHYTENCFIDAPVFAGNGAEVRLRNCSYKYVNRTGTGNILDTSRKLQSGIFHVVDFTWNTVITSANVYVRKSGTGDLQTGGSGQGVMGVRLNSVSYVGVENNVDVTGGLDSSFTCARSIRMHQTYSVSQYVANNKIFMGVRQTVGNAVPTLAGAENYAGFSWNGTNILCQSSNGGGVGQETVLPSSVAGIQRSFEMEILGSKRVDFYRDGILVASHSIAAGVPSGLVDWQRLITSDGGGGATYTYLTLRNGFIEECPQ
jgi:hypothetical protein